MVGFLNTYFELLQFIEIIYITNKCNQYIISLSFIPFVRLFMCNIQTAVSPQPLKIGQVYMSLFTPNSPYYHLLKYLLFLLKHPVYIYIYVTVNVRRSVNPRIYHRELVKVRKMLPNASISGFYQTILVNADIYRHPLVKVRNERWVCPSL